MLTVSVILSSNKDSVQLLGFGTYQGEEVPGPEVKFMGVAVNRPNPKIELDNGTVVWGCECWWGPEPQIKKMIGTKKVLEANIDEFRKENQ